MGSITPVRIAALSLLLVTPAVLARPKAVLNKDLAGIFAVSSIDGPTAQRIPARLELRIKGGSRLALEGLGAEPIAVKRAGRRTLVGTLPTGGGAAGALGGESSGTLPVILRIEGPDELRGQVGDGAAKTTFALSRAKLAVSSAEEALVAKFIRDNSGYDEDRPLPALEDDEISALVYTDLAAAERAMAFVKAWWSEDAEVTGLRFDPAKHLLAAVEYPWDDPEMALVLVNKDGSGGVVIGNYKLTLVDMSTHLDQRTLDRLVPGLGDIETEASAHELGDRLIQGASYISLEE